ncbi:MAG: FliH/SctL family protein, partial [Deltaproteobacteria bacterium]
MSSSRIIKSDEDPPEGLSEFSFKPIGHLPPPTNNNSSTGFTTILRSGESSGFVLTKFHDPSDELDEQEATPEPPGITLSEEELDQRLRDAFKNGLEEGKELAERGLQHVFASLRSAAESLHGLREKVLKESEDELIKLVVSVAGKVIRREVTHDNRILSDIVKAATAGLSARDEIVIHLHPDDYSMVSTNHEDFFRKELLTDKLRLKADPEVSPGSCKVDTEMGTIDASFDSQLNEILRHMHEERGM